MSNEAGFLVAIQAAPDDDTTRRVYADWLDEQGLPGSEFLRVCCELSALDSTEHDQRSRLLAKLRLASQGLDGGWIEVVSRVPLADIRHCSAAEGSGCPLRRDMKLRFYHSKWGEQYYCPHIWVFDVVEFEVQAIMIHAGEDFPGYDGSRTALGQIRRCERYLRVIYVLEPEKNGDFILAAWTLRGHELKACRGRQRSRGSHHRLRAPVTPLVIGSSKQAPEPYPFGWDEVRIQRVLAHYEALRAAGPQAAEDEIAIGSQ